jgi:hypothetical protein
LFFFWVTDNYFQIINEAGQFFIREIELKESIEKFNQKKKIIVLRLNKIIGLEETYSL